MPRKKTTAKRKSHQRHSCLAALLLGCNGGDRSPIYGGASACDTWRLEQVDAFTVDSLGTADPTSQVSYVGPGAALVDLNDDGWLDLAWAPGPWPVTVLMNDGAGGLVVDELARADGEELPSAQVIAAGDMDGDGAVDLWLGRTEPLEDLVLRATGPSTFTAVSMEESSGHTTGGAWADVDGDGKQELFVARHALDFAVDSVSAGEVLGGGSFLYREEGGTMVIASDGWPMDRAEGLAFQGLWLDGDQDGDLDLYQLVDFGWLLGGNTLFENQGDGSFAVDSSCSCAVEIAAMGGTVGDLDGDGWPDLHLSNAGSPVLLLNDGSGDWVDTTLALGAEIPLSDDHVTSWGTLAVDLNGDGREELPVAYGPINFFIDLEDDEYVGLPGGEIVADEQTQRDALLERAADGSWAEVGSNRGFDDSWIGRGLVAGDLDRDGRPELIATGWVDRTHPELRIFQTVGGCGAGLTVAPTDGMGATGARVEVEVGGETLTRWILPSAAFGSSAPEAVVGLGGASQADVVRVIWPDGRTWSQDSVAAGTVLRPDPGL